MSAEDLVTHAIRIYEQELKRFENIDNKANQQIGFVGVIIAIFSFVVGNNFQTLEYLYLIIIGLWVLLFSIIISISEILYPRKKIPVFDLRPYAEDLKNNKAEASILEIYLDNIEELADLATLKARWLAKSYISTLLGIGISFIGILLSIL